MNMSPAYIGQGIIMGPSVTLNMLAGSVSGWAVLSPLAASKGWAPGKVGDWKTGARGWITWISLAVMIADTGVSFIWFILQSPIRQPQKHNYLSKQRLMSFIYSHRNGPNYSPLIQDGNTYSERRHSSSGSISELSTTDEEEDVQDPVERKFRITPGA